MIVSKVISNGVRITFTPKELKVIRTMSCLAEQTDFLTIDDFIRIHLRHAQDQLDCFPERAFDGDPPT